MSDGFNRQWKVVPYRITGGGRTDWGTELPEERQELPEALFAPGASSEDNLLSETINHQGTLRWPRKAVSVDPEDVIEIEGHRWQVHGYPNIWPLGTTVVVRRYK